METGEEEVYAWERVGGGKGLNSIFYSRKSVSNNTIFKIAT